jgi:hypothetical protein
MGWIASGAGPWMDFLLVAAPFFLPVFPLDRNNSGLKKLEDGWVAPASTGGGGMCIYWRLSLQGLSPDDLAFWLRSPPLSPWIVLHPKSL